MQVARYLSRRVREKFSDYAKTIKVFGTVLAFYAFISIYVVFVIYRAVDPSPTTAGEKRAAFYIVSGVICFAILRLYNAIYQNTRIMVGVIKSLNTLVTKQKTSVDRFSRAAMRIKKSVDSLNKQQK